MRSMLIPLVFVIIFGGCAYFEKQRLEQAELDLSEHLANMRESQNALQGIYGDEFMSDFYEEAYEIAREAKELLAERRAQLSK